MNSRKKTILLVLVACVLLAGAISALIHQGGRERDHRAGRRIRSPAAGQPTGGTQTAPPVATAPKPATSTRTRRPYPDPPVSTAGASKAVATFMPGFLAWSQGRAPAGTIKHASAGFIAQARSHPPKVTPAERREQTRILRIRVLAGHPPVAVVDLAPHGGVPYELAFYLLHANGGWQISQLATPGR